jgi:hypothetical protein
MTTNSESATLNWTGLTGTDPFVNPYVNGVRVQDFRSPAIGSFFIEHLRDWADPRIDANAPNGDGGVNRLGIAQGAQGYSGVPSGYAVGAGVVKQAYFYSYDQALGSATYGAKSLQQSPKTGILMNYAELQFILAEAAVKGWINGSAANYYNAGYRQRRQLLGAGIYNLHLVGRLYQLRYRGRYRLGQYTVYRRQNGADPPAEILLLIPCRYAAVVRVPPNRASSFTKRSRFKKWRRNASAHDLSGICTVCKSNKLPAGSSSTGSRRDQYKRVVAKAVIRGPLKIRR